MPNASGHPSDGAGITRESPRQGGTTAPEHAHLDRFGAPPTGDGIIDSVHPLIVSPGWRGFAVADPGGGR